MSALPASLEALRQALAAGERCFPGLRLANLRGCDLCDTQLSDARLEGARLDGARLPAG